MTRILSVQIDEETGALVDHDLEQLSQASGRSLTVSQYLRLVLEQRLRGGAYDPEEAGWGEGFRRGLADARAAFETFMAQQRARGPTDVP